jgi:outer membrane protein assembly factor BamB
MRQATSTSRRPCPRRVGMAAAVAAISLALAASPAAASGMSGGSGVRRAVARAAAEVDWVTYGFDAQRSGYNPDETTIGTGNAGQLAEQWSTKLNGVVVAQPVVAAGVDVSGTPTDLAYVGTEHGLFYAIDTATGSKVWKRKLGMVHVGCPDLPNGDFGIGGTAVLDRGAGLVYVAGGDGKVHAMDLATGAEAPGWPIAKVFKPKHEHVYSALNLFGGDLYVTIAGECDIAPYHGRAVQIDVASRQIVHTFYPAGRSISGGGIWGPGGASIDPGTGHAFVATGNALTDPEYYRYSDSVVELSSTLKVLGSDHPVLFGDDLDFGATPILFQRPGCPPQMAAKNKSGVLVVYTRGDLGAGPTQRLQIGTVADDNFNGIPAYSPVTDMLYIGNSSDSDDPTYEHGMVALRVRKDCSLSLSWQKVVGPNMVSVSPPTVANGVVYYGDGPGRTEFAFDAATGTQLWNSASTIGGDLYAAPTVVNGRLLVASWDEHLYAFAP